ncbi:MAG: AraC family transcriptional regulator [Pleurocapsa minor GSE-CHR-MK-17-07R]|jgi:AraC-like DNA-binding protein|nr:AraC family transcriptional regulator [Pleurocapsa minor GSE-CHR-MK 17-07R]
MREISRVLQVLQFHPTMFHRLPWTTPYGVTLSSLNGGAVHMVEKGSWLLLRFDAPEVTMLQPGDVVVVSHMARYALVEQEDGDAPMLEDVLRQRDAEGVVRTTPGLPVSAVLICGEFRVLHESFHWLFRALPPVILIRGEDGQAVEWYSSAMRMIQMEFASAFPGNDVVISRLMDVLFIMCLRYWLVHQPQSAPNWFSALSHPQLGQALSAIHMHPEKAWTVESMAEAAMMSRSAFAARFKEAVSTPPMIYLTRWRLGLAAMWLMQNRTWSIEEVAARVGYTDPFAFSKAFKRAFGVSPSEYRTRYFAPAP